MTTGDRGTWLSAIFTFLTPKFYDEKTNKGLATEDYIMGMAYLSAQRSKDPCTQVGACIVDENMKIVSTGYNGMPWGCSDDVFPWAKNTPDPVDSKHLYVVHAEENAIITSRQRDLSKCAIYVTLFPCHACAKLIIQAGIRKVIYAADTKHHKSSTVASKRMLDAAKVSYRQFTPLRPSITISFTDN